MSRIACEHCKRAFLIVDQVSETHSSELSLVSKSLEGLGKACVLTVVRWV